MSGLKCGGFEIGRPAFCLERVQILDERGPGDYALGGLAGAVEGPRAPCNPRLLQASTHRIDLAWWLLILSVLADAVLHTAQAGDIPKCAWVILSHSVCGCV